MSTDDRDDRIEDLLRTMLQDEAESMHPAGDGLSRIQQRVAARRARARWLRPVAVLGSVAALTAGGLGAFALVNNSNDTDNVISHNPTPTEQPSVTPTPTVTTPVALAHFPARAIYPFTSAAMAKSWEDGGGAHGEFPAFADADKTALAFVHDMLGETSVSTVTDAMMSANGKTATVTLGRKLQGESNRTIDVTRVHLLHFGNAWLVVGADDAAGLLTVTSPAPGEPVSSPLAVSGPGFGVDEAIRVQLVTLHGGPLGGTGHASFGGGTPKWSTTVTFPSSPDPAGGIVVIDDSPADGLPGRIAVVPVRFDTTAATYPGQFVGIKNGRVTLFTSRNGAALKYLTEQQPGGGAGDPQLSTSGDLVYFIQGSGTCSNALMSVTTGGNHDVRRVAAPDSGYAMSGYAAGPAGQFTFYETACSGSTSPQARLVTVDARGQRTAIDFPSQPPMVVADPSFEPPAQLQLLDAIVRTGNSATLARYDVGNDTAPIPSRNACPDYDINKGMPLALETDGRGRTWFATQTGSSMAVVECSPGEHLVKTVFSIAGNDQPADVDVTSDGSAVLLTDVHGKVWRWTEGGQPVQLSPSVPLTQVSW
jgi:hypothetical protein